MSREADFATRMIADATLVGILTGGVFKREAVGIEGVTRESAPTAFDADGYLLPCALIKQRGLVPDGILRDDITQQTSAAQVVEVWIYADSGAGWSAIDSAMDRVYTLFQGYQFSDSAPVQWVNTLDRERDTGALAGSSLARIDFVVYSVRS